MSKSLLDTIQTGIHSTSLAILGITVLVIVIACIRPQLFKQLFHSFSERKYIITCGVFIVLLSGTIFVATQPMHQQSYASENSKKTVQAVNPIEAQQTLEEPTIKIEEVAVPQAIPYARQQQNDAALPQGQTRVVQSGIQGQKSIIYSVTYKDGAEVSRVLKNEIITVAAQPEITAVGTYVAPAPQPGPSATSQPSPTPSAAAPQQSQQQSHSNNSICKNSRSWLCSLFR